ncbi:hypothetical protein YB2330_002763 [Saitoella coloradoensis]
MSDCSPKSTDADKIAYLTSILTSPLMSSGHQKHLLRTLKAVSVDDDWNIVLEMEVDDELCNPMGNLHGGAMALIVDVCTSFSGMARGIGIAVSRNLSVSYLRPAPNGCKIQIETEVVSISKRMALYRCTIRDAETKKIIAVGEHDKAILGGSHKL